MKRNYGNGNMNIELMQLRSFLKKNYEKGISSQKVGSGCGEKCKVVVKGEASEPQWQNQP